MLALLGALREEIIYLKNGMAIEEAYVRDGCCVFSGRYGEKPVLLAQTGVGRRRAETAATFILEQYPVAALVSFGFAGALTEAARIGDIVLCSTLYGSNGEMDDKQMNSPCHSDSSLLSLAEKALKGMSIRVLQGNSVTVKQVVTGSEAKRALGETYHAQAVDMESYWIARIAAARKVPFLAVRAISDAVQPSLPPLNQIVDCDGRLIKRRAIPYLLSHPYDIAKLLTLRRNVRLAGRNLTASIDCIITEVFSNHVTEKATYVIASVAKQSPN